MSTSNTARANEPHRPDPWICIDVRLFSKLDRSQELKGLRPITLLETSCKMFSRVMLRHCENRDAEVPGSAGFRKALQCSELVAVLPSTAENGLGTTLVRVPARLRAGVRFDQASGDRARDAYPRGRDAGHRRVPARFAIVPIRIGLPSQLMAHSGDNRISASARVAH